MIIDIIIYFCLILFFVTNYKKKEKFTNNYLIKTIYINLEKDKVRNKKYIKDNMGRLEDHHLYKKIIIQNNFLIKIQTDDDNKSPKMKFVIYEDKGYSYNDKSEEKTIIHIGGVFMNTASNSKKSDKGRIFINTASNSEDFTKSKNRSFDKKQYYYLDLSKSKSKSNKIDNLNSKYLLTLSVLFDCEYLRPSFRQEPSKMKCSHYPTPKKKYEMILKYFKII